MLEKERPDERVVTQDFRSKILDQVFNLKEVSPAVRPLLEDFLKITGIPRQSRDEGNVRDYLVTIACQQQWKYRIDSAGNLVIYVPGRGRAIHHQPLALQCHMDMVCVPAQRDFSTRPIIPQIRRQDILGVSKLVLGAKDSNLGADNGIGIGSSLALAIHPGISCPPLELVYTVNEEDGMTGARNFDGSMLRARQMINLDGEEFDSMCCAAAGANRMTATLALARKAALPEQLSCRVSLQGLQEGHSGLDIHRGTGNALVILGRAAARAFEQVPEVRVAAVAGGDLASALPTTSEIIFWCPRKVLGKFETVLRREVDASLAQVAETQLTKLTIAPTDTSFLPLELDCTKQILAAFARLPDGVHTMSSQYPGVVQTSSNLGICRTSQNALSFALLPRSMEKASLEWITSRLENVLQDCGFRTSVEVSSRPWSAEREGPLYRMAESVFLDIFGRPLPANAVHGGVECGLFAEHFPSMQIISCGPDIVHVHSRREAVVLDSLEPFWNFLTSLVNRL